MAEAAWRKAVKDPLTWVFFIPSMVLTFAWEPVRALGWPWYVEAVVFIGGFTALAMLIALPWLVSGKKAS